MSTRRLLADLSDADLVRVVTEEVSARDSMSAIRTPLVALLAMGPTLTAATKVDESLIAQAVQHAHDLLRSQATLLQQPLFTSVQVAEAVGKPGVIKPGVASTRSQASRLRQRGQIIGLEVQGRFLYPAFQFELAKARVYPEVIEVNTMLDAQADPWRAALWWLSRQGKSVPAELVGKNEDRLLRLARNQLEAEGQF